MKIASENRFSGKTYFYTIGYRVGSDSESDREDVGLTALQAKKAK